MKMMKNAIFVLLFVSVAHADALKPAPAWSKDATSWDSGTYVYDAAGNIRAVGADVYTYDAFGRLRSATAITPSSPTNAEVFDYDRYGNLLKNTRTSSVGVEGLANAVNPSSNRLGGGPCPAPYDRCYTGAYDAAGNQTGAVSGVVQYQWDALGMMTDLNLLDRPEEYVYDANDERIVVLAKNGGPRRFTFRGADNKVSREVTYNPQSDTWTWTRDYVYRSGLLYAEYLASESGPGPHRQYHLDHLGTPRLITDSAGYKHSIHTYWAFGQEAAGSEVAAGERMKFTGHELDSNPAAPGDDLYYMHARYHNEFTERFLSVDPSMDLDKIVHEPQLWNRYAYVGNNPIRYTDPDGKERLPCAAFAQTGRCAPVPWRGNATELGEMFTIASMLGMPLPGEGWLARGFGAIGRFFGAASEEVALSRGIMTALKSAEAATRLEGEAAAALGETVTGFQKVVTQGGKVVGEIDVETTKAIVEVTNGASPRKLQQITKLIGNKTLNPNGKPVVVYGPNLGRQAAQALEKAGAKVVRTLDQLKAVAQ